MASILCITNCLKGMLYSSVELARRLAEAGHRVTYAGPEHARSTVELQGLEFACVDQSRYPDFLTEDASRGFLERLQATKQRRRRALDSLRLESFLHVVDRTDPDLLLIDGELAEHVLAVANRGIPIALLNTFVSIWRSPGLPPPNQFAVPGRGWRGSTWAAGLSWTRLRLSGARRNWIRKLQRVGCDRVSLLRELASENSVDFDAFTDFGQWLRPFTFSTLPVLSLHSQELEFRHTPPNHVRFVGPMPLEERGEPDLSEADQARLRTVFERRRTSEGRRKVVFASFGSFFTSDFGFVRRLCQAIAMQPDWDLVVSLGGRSNPAELGDLPDRVHVFHWLPQLAVLRHADAVVSHGGANTIDECLLNGVPMLLYCGYLTDMAGGVSRVVYHRVGIAGDREKDDAAQIHQRLECLLGDESFRRNAERFQRDLEAYRRDRIAEEAVESLLGTGSFRR